MDNDNKVAENDSVNVKSRDSVRLFLKDELIPLEKNHKAKSSYDLVKEYALTRKNRSYFIWGMMLFCVVSVASITFAVITTLDRQNKKIEINPNVFNDLDMSNFLGTRSHIEMQKIISENTLNQLVKERDYEKSLAANRRDAGLQLVSALRAEDADTRRKKILADYSKEMAKISAEFDEKISAAEKKLKMNEEALLQLDSSQKDSVDIYDFSNMVKMHERSYIVNSFQKTVSELQNQLSQERVQFYSEQKKAVSTLANKYHKTVDSLDPILKDDEAESIIANAEKSGSQKIHVMDFLKSLPQNILTADFVRGMKSAEKLFEDYDYIHGKVENIPQKNSIQKYKKTEGNIINSIASEISSAFSSQIHSLNNIRIGLENEKSRLLAEKQELIGEKQRIQAEKQEIFVKNASLEEKINEMNREYEVLENVYEGVSGNLQMFENWFESQAKIDSVSGYILDKSSVEKVKIFVVKDLREQLFENAQMMEVVVNHGKRKKVSAGRIFCEDGVCYFTADDFSTIEKISNGDRILKVDLSN